MATLPVLLIWTPHIVADTHVVFKVLKQLHHIGTNSEKARVLGKWQYNNFQNKRLGFENTVYWKGRGKKRHLPENLINEKSDFLWSNPYFWLALPAILVWAGEAVCEILDSPCQVFSKCTISHWCSVSISILNSCPGKSQEESFRKRKRKTYCDIFILF